MQNLIRAITARQTVSEYMEPGFGGPDGVRQGLVDLVADLMHLCDAPACDRSGGRDEGGHQCGDRHHPLLCVAGPGLAAGPEKGGRGF